MQCVLDVQLATYTRQESQTWTLTGTAPKHEGEFRIFNATWTVTGRGRVNATAWTVNVPATPVKLAMFIRASDQKLIIRQWSSLKQIPGALNGTTSTTQFFRPASEWSFLWLDEDKNQTSLDGSKLTNADALPADFIFFRRARERGMHVAVQQEWRLVEEQLDPTARQPSGRQVLAPGHPACDSI